LAEIFPPEAIIIGPHSRTREGVILELVHALVELGHLHQEEEEMVAQSILAREKLGSTSLRHGIAFPHCRSSSTEKFIGVLALDPEGIPFDVVDDEPVRSIFLFLAPLDRREELYDILGRITALGRDKSRRCQLRGCQTVQAVHQFLRELDNQ
jgi:mannitol/fructose-specific phosphotransferase system IIA component (Ntr-type)